MLSPGVISVVLVLAIVAVLFAMMFLFVGSIAIILFSWIATLVIKVKER